MKKKIFCLGLFLFVFSLVMGAQPYSLSSCCRKARENYPLLQGKEHLARTTELTIRNVRNQWLPRTTISGQASWQNEVPGLGSDAAMPAMSLPEAPKDQYKVVLDVDQTLYNGGRISARSKLEKTSGALKQQDIEVKMYELKKRVTLLYFNILMLSEKVRLTETKIQTLEARMEELRQLVKHGAVDQSEMQVLKAEYHQVSQQLLSVRNDLGVLLDHLSSFIGEEVSSASNLKEPEAGELLNPDIHPERRVFELRRKVLDHQIYMVKRDRMPVVGAFAQAGYGNPGFNMLQDEFSPLLMVGLRVKWTPWNWNQTRREKWALQEQKELVNRKEETFHVNQKRTSRRLEGQVQKYLNLMEHDDEIVRLREAVVAKSEKRLKNGTITSSDYISDLDAVMNARINRNVHHLQYLQNMAMKRLEDVSAP